MLKSEQIHGMIYNDYLAMCLHRVANTGRFSGNKLKIQQINSFPGAILDDSNPRGLDTFRGNYRFSQLDL